MRLDGYAGARVGESQVLRADSEGLSVWTAYSGYERDGNTAWFSLSHGNIVVKNPDPEILRKMYGIAQQLSARVQGEDGELYDSQGTCLLRRRMTLWSRNGGGNCDEPMPSAQTLRLRGDYVMLGNREQDFTRHRTDPDS